MQYVIVGNGIAGISAVEAIRRLAPSSHITIIGDETVIPYSRPMISMVLDGSIPPEKLPIRLPTIYEDLNIQTYFGKRISEINVERHEVVIENNQRIPFDRLLLATGADARPIQFQGSNLKNIHYMRTDANVRQIIRALPEVRKPLVLGGGLVGFKAAYGLLKRGLKPTLLITSPYPLSMQVDKMAGTMIRDELVRHGLTVQTNTSVTACEGSAKVEGARLSDGSALPCDLVIAGKGVVPALSFVPRDIISVDQGIRVDAHMETSRQGIFAAGDVAECVDIARKTRWINAIWPEAAMQGRIAGINMAGRKVFYPGSLSRNVMRIFDLDLMTLGLANPKPESGYDVRVAQDFRNNIYRKLVFRENILVGAVLLNNIEQGGLLLALIRNQISLNISKKNLLEPGFNFKQLLSNL
ncbi:MAG: pyridine nucleotide-disulfide oxidoreductase [Desulfobacteraceae bacterium 4572_87]|nr:MAG: pyridine nucleotide-disulfide oxidoreductase [Desulfobacteraceae bacterium 4572_87]